MDIAIGTPEEGHAGEEQYNAMSEQAGATQNLHSLQLRRKTKTGVREGRTLRRTASSLDIHPRMELGQCYPDKENIARSW